MKSGGDKGKTSNVMEMTAVLQSMKAITDKSIPVEMFSDSKYVVETLNGNFEIKKNVELWQELMAEKEKFADMTRTGIILRLIKWRLWRRGTVSVNDILILIKAIINIAAIIGNVGILIYLWIDKRR